MAPDLAVLRVHHSGVVGAFRQRESELRDAGVDVTLVTARVWDEGGRPVPLVEAGGSESVVGAWTLGQHPYGFVYDPRALWREIRHVRWDVVDLHEEPASLATAEVLVLLALAGRRRTPVCLYSAQNIHKVYPVPFRWLERLALRRAAAIHTCNDEAGRILRRKGFRGIIRNLGLGVDVSRFAPRPVGTDRTVPPLRVGYVGRLERHKGVDVALRALARLDDVSLTVVGDGPVRAELEALASELGLGGRVVFGGFADHEQLPDVYRSFDVVVVPSVETESWIEQFGRVAVEAMASGVAVVASASGSLPEVVAGSGLLVPPGDVEALAGALGRLRDDPGRLARCAAEGRERATRYSWAAIAARQVELYRQVTA